MARNSESSKERKVQCYGLREKGVEDVGHGGISKHGGRPQEMVLEGRLKNHTQTLLAC